MSEEKVIAAIQKNEFTQVRVVIKTYEDRDYLHVRQFIRSKDEDLYKPTTKGVALQMDQARELCEAFEQLSTELDEQEMSDLSFGEDEQ